MTARSRLIVAGVARRLLSAGVEERRQIELEATRRERNVHQLACRTLEAMTKEVELVQLGREIGDINLQIARLEADLARISTCGS